jgi:protein-disulfide isomerase
MLNTYRIYPNRRLNLHSLSVLLVFSAVCWSSSYAQKCSDFTDKDREAIVTYMKRQFEVPDDSAITIGAVEMVDNTCYRRMKISGLPTDGALIAYMSPDKRYLTSNLADLTSDPRELKKKLRLEAEHRLVSMSSPSGDSKLTVVLTEFIDYQCPYCRQFTTWLEGLPPELRTQIGVRYVNLPLPMHPWAHSAALYAVCIAGHNGDLNQFRKTLFLEQPEITEARLRKVAEDAFGGTPTDLMACYAAAGTRSQLDQQMELAKDLRINGTPAFFLNGRQVAIRSKDELADMVRDALKASPSTSSNVNTAHGDAHGGH